MPFACEKYTCLKGILYAARMERQLPLWAHLALLAVFLLFLMGLWMAPALLAGYP